MTIVDRHGHSFAERPDEGQLAIAVSQAIREAAEVWNDRDVVRRKGIDGLRRMVEKDLVIYSAMRSRRERLLRRGWEFLPWEGSNQPDDVDRADVIRRALELMLGSFKDDLADILDAVGYGYSITEIVWALDGSMWMPQKLEALLPENYRFVVDKFGTVVALNQVQPIANKGLPPEKFIIAKYRGKPGDPHGGPIYANVFWADWFKQEVTKYWLMANERFGMPTLMIHYPRSANPATRGEADALLDKIQAATAVHMSEDLKAELLESSQGNYASFDRFIERMKEEIRIGIVGQTLTSSAGDKGTQALGTVHNEEFEQIVDSDRAWLEAVVNDQLVRRIGDINWGDGRYPEFRIRPREDMGPQELAQWFTTVNGLGVDIPTAWAYERLGIPRPEAGDDVLEARQPQAPAFPPQGAFRERPEDGAGEPAHELRFIDVDETGWTGFAGDPEDGGFWRPFTEFETASVVRGIDRTSRALLDAVRDQGRAIWTGIRDGLVAQVERSGAIDKGTLRIELKPRMRDWDDLVTRLWATANANGRASAADELQRLGAGLKQFRADSVGVSRFDELTDVSSLDAAKAWLGDRVPMTDAEFSRLAKDARQQAFYVTTRESSEAVAQVYDALKQALDNGWAFADFKRDVERRFKVWTGDIFGGGNPSIAQADQRLATVFRTSIMTALNRGRDHVMEIAEDPDAATDPVVAYQYSAVMDSRTRASHAAMDGRVYAKDDPIWLRWKPPAGYNCRCIRVPILASRAAKLPGNDLSTVPPVLDGKPVEPDAGFGRMSFSDGARSGFAAFHPPWGPWKADDVGVCC